MNTKINDCNVAQECAGTEGGRVMDDRELLELAAKAAGLVGECHLLLGDCSDPEEPGGFRYKHPDGGHEWWNPLMDDGDALRLAARLNINISFRENQNGAWVIAERNGYSFCPESLDGPHEYDATRRAIVRAAAEIGKGM